MSRTDGGQSSLVIGLATLLRNNGELVLGGSSTLTLPVTSLQQLNRLFEQHLLSRNQQHGFLALPSHPADTASLLQLQFLFDILQKTFSLKLFNPSSLRLQFGVKIFPFKSLKCLELKNIPPHCLEGLRGVYSQLEVFICSKSLSSLEELLSLCGGDLSSALPWLELHTLNFSYNFIICLDQSLSLLNVLKSLDLSHNKIQECAEFLKPLSELEHLNLGYNCLQRAPTLSLSARVKLLTLILRNNELETINGVEQLASLQHLDLAYNLMLEHSQLAPLSLLHSLKMLNLDGNPLYFQKTHRTCTVRHLSPKAVGLRFKLDGVLLSSSELSVLPKPGQLIIQVQSSPPAVLEQSHGDVSSGAGELSDSLSVGEMRVSRGRKKKSKTKVKVRRASISEPSDTDYQAVSSQDIVLPHQEEIERMSSFREQLGEDWLRYQHHLDADVAPPTTTSVHGPETLSNSLVTSLCLSPEVLPPSLISSEPRVPKPDVEAEHETDSTLQWPSQSPQHTESTLEETAVDGQVEGLVHSRRPSLDSHKSAGEESGDFKEAEDEKDLGVDQCLPLLVGVLSDKEEEDEKSQDKGRKEVFLRVKQDHLLEVDVQSGQERCRLGLDCLAKVDATEAAWTHRKNNEIYPAVEIQFDYIMKEKRRRLYVLLDDNPQQALKDLVDVLSPVAEANRGRDTRLLPDCVHLQCLRCGSEFMEPGGRGRSLRPMMLPEGVDEQDGKALMECDVGDKGNCDNCPECGSDHLIQVAAQSFPYSSTPIQRPSRPSSVEKKVNSSMSSSLEEPAATVATEEPTFFSTQGSSLYIEEGGTEKFSLTCNADCQSKEELAGSYSYTTICATPPGIQLLGRANLTDDLDALSEAFEVVDHRLKLFLDVDIFEEEEELSCFLKTSIVKFGEVEEFPSLVVVSDKRVYILEVSPGASKGQLSDWLQKRDRHPILELSYLEVGLGSQSIHMAFDDGEVTGMAYTLLVRDSKRCKHFFGLLTGIVREMAHRSDSKLRSISTARLNPHHHLWPLVCEDIQTDVEDGHLQFCYILAFFLQDNMWTPMTVLATRETLYLLREDHQWGKSTNHLTTVNSTAEPSSGTFTVLETLPISCVSSVHLWSNEQCQMDVKLYDETQKEEKTWNLRSESSELLQALLVWVRTQWEAMFGVRLSTTVD